jgi:molecular chaperone GrpE (heat shock protein)
MSLDALAEAQGQARKLIRELAQARHEQRESTRAREAERHEALLKLIEVADAFERVFKSVAERPEQVTGQTKVWVGNFRAVKRLLERLIEERGARRYDAGSLFDPHRHRVIETVADPTRGDGEILEQLRAGYEVDGEVLRKAELRVVKNEE